MNCDQAFTALTDLSPRHDRGLAEHLRRCARCRDMAEALAPVLGVWSDVAVAEVPLPNSAAALAPPPQAPAQRRQRPARAPLARSTESSTARKVGLHVATFAAGLVVALGLQSLMSPSTGDARMEAPLTACLWQQPEQERREVPGDAGAVVLSCVSCHLNPPGGETWPAEQDRPAVPSARTNYAL